MNVTMKLNLRILFLLLIINLDLKEREMRNHMNGIRPGLN